MEEMLYKGGLGLWCLMPLSTIFQLYRGGQRYFFGGNQNTWRDPPTCCKSLTNFTPRHERDSNNFGGDRH
jgi:hypothetical protein